jgi:hypothetical protein
MILPTVKGAGEAVLDQYLGDIAAVGFQVATGAAIVAGLGSLGSKTAGAWGELEREAADYDEPLQSGFGSFTKGSHLWALGSPGFRGIEPDESDGETPETDCIAVDDGDLAWFCFRQCLGCLRYRGWFARPDLPHFGDDEIARQQVSPVWLCFQGANDDFSFLAIRRAVGDTVPPPRMDDPCNIPEQRPQLNHAVL